jgi:hypothetical protein
VWTELILELVMLVLAVVVLWLGSEVWRLKAAVRTSADVVATHLADHDHRADRSGHGAPCHDCGARNTRMVTSTPEGDLWACEGCSCTWLIIPDLV